MAQPPYLLANRHRRPLELTQVEQFGAHYDPVYRRSRRGGFVTETATGSVRKDVLELWCYFRHGKQDGLDMILERVRRDAASVKAILRRLRDQEAQQLDEVDERIDALTRDYNTAVGALREQRDAILHTAWQKANVVHLAEVESTIKD